MARRYPNARFTAVSNSASQKEFIDRAGLPNVTVVTADMNTFSTSERFDRVVSVEMFEHMRNVALLFERISTWLNPGGLLFLHVFNHATFAYPYEDKDPSDWMARHFFTGGMMPSQHLYAGLNQHLRVTEHHQVSGTHYERTSNAWLRNLDAHHDDLWPVMEATYGAQAKQFWAFWRVFFLACAELFGLDGGTQWGVGHYVLEPATPDNKDASLRRG
jgi:cyclopropane-fatty-acyl-phospholipid synthase